MFAKYNIKLKIFTTLLFLFWVFFGWRNCHRWVEDKEMTNETGPLSQQLYSETGD